MKKIFNKKSRWVVAIALLIALAALISFVAGSSGGDSISRAGNVFLRPVRSMMSSLVGSLENVYSYMYDHDRLKAENEALKARVAELEDEYHEYIEVNEENERLRDLLGLSQRRSDFKYESASVISWTSSNWRSSFTINKGSSSGLELYDCIITENGYVVGQITELGLTSSTVSTLLDPGSGIGAVVSGTGDDCVAQGDFTLMPDGKLKLTFIADSSTLIAGDEILTSGKGGAFPRGLMIGTVSEMVKSATGFEDYAVVTPSASLDDLFNVFVITDFEITE